MMNRFSSTSILLAALGCVAAVVAGVKIAVLDVGLGDLAPQPAHQVTLRTSFEGRGTPMHVRTFLPESSARQHVTITPLRGASSEVRFATEHSEHGLQGVWRGTPSSGRHVAGVEMQIESTPVAYTIPADLRLPPVDGLDDDLRPHLEATDVIQVDDPTIQALAADVIPDTDRALPVVRALFDAVANMESTPFRGLTDAVTAAKLGEASCNGMSRLLVALARHRGIPARLVGGFIMEPGEKRTSHQWVELHLGARWVPFDALNDHFASLPANYLTLYRGDAFLFGHTPAIDFDYRFETRSTPGRTPMGAAQRASAHGAGGEAVQTSMLASTLSWLDASTWWRGLANTGIPLHVLRVLLLLPVAATVVVLFRNVVGFDTYGTFLPALLAVACLETGLGWGLVGFYGIVLLVAALHRPLEALGLLRTPKMAILLVAVVAALLGLAAGSAGSGVAPLTQLSFFPVVILAAAAERVSTQLDEDDGFERVLIAGGTTGLVIAACYVVLASDVLARVLLIFPEMLLLVVAANVWLGRWIGLRLTEYRRFRWLSPQRPVPAAVVDEV